MIKSVHPVVADIMFRELLNIYLKEQTDVVPKDNITDIIITYHILNSLDAWYASNSHNEITIKVLQYTRYLFNKLIILHKSTLPTDIKDDTNQITLSVLNSVNNAISILKQTKMSNSYTKSLLNDIHTYNIASASYISNVNTDIINTIYSIYILFITHNIDILLHTIFINHLHSKITNQTEPFILGAAPAGGLKPWEEEYSILVLSKELPNISLGYTDDYDTILDIYSNRYKHSLEMYNSLYVESALTNVY